MRRRQTATGGGGPLAAHRWPVRWLCRKAGRADLGQADAVDGVSVSGRRCLSGCPATALDGLYGTGTEVELTRGRAVYERVADAGLGGAAVAELRVAEVTQRAFLVAGLRLEVAAVRSVEPQAGGHHPADLVGRMTVERRVGHGVAVVAAAGVVDRAADYRRGPGLVDTQFMTMSGKRIGTGSANRAAPPPITNGLPLVVCRAVTRDLRCGLCPTGWPSRPGVEFQSNRRVVIRKLCNPA